MAVSIRKTLVTWAIVALLLALAAAPAAAAPASAAAVSPFNTQGMWIWYVNQAEGGRLAMIVRKARRAQVKTLFVKSGDGVTYWTQFDQVIAPLKAMGMRVCAWQYVYGSDPVAEAALGARAVAAGADCLVIDAESEYYGRYAAAQTYITSLRSQIGSAYPLGLASFAYPDYHPRFPYSVFLGPGGAQWNLPQMYFKAFGKPVPEVFARTYSLNSVYGRPIRPLGQTYSGVRAKQVIEFRKYARLYGALGISWWDWQETRRDAWVALRRKLHSSTLGAASSPYPQLGQGARGDLVRWAQLHLVAAGFLPGLNGDYNATMMLTVQAFQQQRGIPLTGVLDQTTWQLLLAVPLPPPAAAPSA